MLQIGFERRVPILMRFHRGERDDRSRTDRIKRITQTIHRLAFQAEHQFRVRMGPYGTASELADAKGKLEGGGLEALPIKVQ